jgi:hypothetical protein
MDGCLPSLKREGKPRKVAERKPLFKAGGFVLTFGHPFDKNTETLIIGIYPIGVFSKGGVEGGGETGDYGASQEG